MADTADYAALKAPISADKPCGEYLEDTQAMAAFDALRLFGQTMPPAEAPDWRGIRAMARDALGQSKDFRLLAHLAACDLRLSGLPALSGLLDVAAHWIEQYWDGVYPPIDDDAIFRRNALNSFADRFAMVDGLRRLALVSHPQLGRVSIRDIEGGAEPAGDAEGAVHVDAAAVFASVATADLASLQQQAKAAIGSLKQIDGKMRDAGGSEAAPDFDALLSALVLVDRTVGQHLAGRGGDEPAAAGTDADGQSNPPGGTTVAVGSIRTRQDAIRALDAVATWFRQNEPSSPVPMFVDRAKRLVSMDFLDILADVAPDGVGQARSAGGIRDN
jgi:type VI secretion system protein ImpA